MEDIVKAIGELDDSERVKTLINQMLAQKTPATEIMEKGIRKGLDVVGQKFEAGEYFLAELLFAGSLINDALGVLKPHLDLEKLEKRGTIVLGTVRGSIHDIGKNIFKIMAEASGFEVHDLGVDVEPERFVEIERLEKAGMRHKCKVIIGGGAVTKEFGQKIGADGVALNAAEGVELCKRMVRRC